ncbi:hypothetical protein EMPS_03817 [Entomortierella parvispora]|uniref:F-box domain-containing protein n=1 Tax=Entomortierella parvispora TaxID=205924 RepID=A0A9P3LUY4_9FUNG|nr:hypothetical protein EMPS_03817 [Entomortierella parvispora]
MASIPAVATPAGMRTTTRTQVPLPTEIVKLIAHQLRDSRQALHACLLVSRAWSQAAVEYLYKAEHMRIDQDLDILWSLASASPVPSTERTTVPATTAPAPTGESPLDSGLTDQSELMVAVPGSEAAGPSGKNTSMATYLQHTLGALLTLAPQDRRPEILSQLLLKRTLDESLLHDHSCSYDYISYLNRVSCPWFACLIQDWSVFCLQWRSHQARERALELDDDTPLGSEPSLIRQEHCFNRLVRKVSSRCTSVEVFCSSFMVHVDTLIYAIRHFPSLTWIDLKDCQELNDEFFVALAETVRSLSYLRLPGAMMRQVSIPAVANVILAQKQDSLCQFKVIHGTNIFETNDILKALGERHGRSLKRLTLSICELENAGLEDYIPLCTNLESLNLEYTSGVTNDVVIPILDHCRQLCKLDLTETDCTQVMIQALSTASDSTTPSTGRFPRMSRLILNNIDSPFTPQQFMPLPEACPNLQELHMNSILADSFQEFHPFISKMVHLMDLDIGNVFPEFTDANLKSLVDALPHLRWLSIANTQITDASLVYLAEKSTELCDLCILGCDQVTKSGLLEFLDKLTNKALFRRLDITYCRLDEEALAEIRERVQWMAKEYGVPEVVEVEGDDQFADSLTEEDEEDEGAEERESEDETGADSEDEEDMDDHSISIPQVDTVVIGTFEQALAAGDDFEIPSGFVFGAIADSHLEDPSADDNISSEPEEQDEGDDEDDHDQEELLSDFSDTFSDHEGDSFMSFSGSDSVSSARSWQSAMGHHRGIVQMLQESRL